VSRNDCDSDRVDSGLISKDVAGNVVAHHGAMIRTLRYAVLLSALAAAASCGSSKSAPTAPSPGNNSPTGVSIVNGARALGNTAYAPNPVTVSVGTTVTWTNNDTTAHNATSDSGAFSSGTMAPGAQFSFTFQSKGNFPYHCTFHPGMVATVVVQ
jgi:plastocyanin